MTRLDLKREKKQGISAVDELRWAKGQFQGIRCYTNDGKVAAACAEAEVRIMKTLGRLNKP